MVNITIKSKQTKAKHFIIIRLRKVCDPQMILIECELTGFITVSISRSWSDEIIRIQIQNSAQWSRTNMRKICKLFIHFKYASCTHVNRSFQGACILNPISNFRNEHIFGALALFTEKRQESIMYIKLCFFRGQGIQIWSLNGCICAHQIFN